MIKTLFFVLLGVMCIVVVLVIIEFIVVKNNGAQVDAPIIPRETQVSGSGPKLTYVVMGDSTTISQGSEYQDGYVIASVKHLAKNYTVTFANVGISGATAKTVLDNQLAGATAYKPDVVLLAVGANDATAFTSSRSIQASIQSIIDGLRAANPSVRIIVTGSPAMDSVTRFPFISKLIMRLRTYQVNKAFEQTIAKNSLTLAPIAEKTRAAFLADPTLTAVDKFHPNARGYALWIPVINRSLDEALTARM